MSGFDSQAAHYDEVAQVQAQVAARLAARLGGAPARILEIGCGTGFLSQHLAQLFPAAQLVLTDISAPMLAQARQKLGAGPQYRVMDGQYPDLALGQFDLITASLAFQWFDDLQGALARLGQQLAPGGVLAFATLGAESFADWRAAHAQTGRPSGLRDYVRAEAFPWPPGHEGQLAVEMIEEPHASGLAFLRSVKRLGAAASPASHRPIGAGSLRALLRRFEHGYTARYQILYGRIGAR